MGLTNQSMGQGAAERDLHMEKRNESDVIVALAGNPNVGKSTVFNALTGMHQHTGNWTGKTVQNAVGYAKKEGIEYCIVDLPGCYSLASYSAEEEVARQFIASQKADAVIIVCDATCMERNLILALEILRITSRAVLCINLLDEAKKKHIQVDLVALEEILDIPVVGTEARKRKGLSELLRAVHKVAVEKERKTEWKKKATIEEIVQKAEEINRKVVHMQKEKTLERDRKLDRIFTSKVWGFPVMFLLLFVIFWLTVVGANYPSQVLSEFLFGMEGPLRRLFSFLPSLFSEMLISGAYRVTAWVVSVMLPPMAIFFPLFTILEDLGYLPRVAFNLDRCFKKCRTSGKQALTMC